MSFALKSQGKQTILRTKYLPPYIMSELDFFQMPHKGSGEKSCHYIILRFRMSKMFCKTATFSLKTNGKDIQKSCKINEENNRLIMVEK